MSTILIGILALVAGALFCFYGIVAMRVVIAAWGAFVGFNVGAGLVSAVSNDGYLGTAVGWIVGIVVALLFALLAYLYYAVAITLAMASIGFTLGTAVMVALGIDWNWLIILIGVVAGVLLAWLALAVDLPAVVLVVLSALGGATVFVAGLMFLTSSLTTAEVSRGTVTATIGAHWWWWLIYAALALAGVVAQSRLMGSGDDARQRW
ncbi:DUF4203 domain-containing protein [Gordonia phosphorivorans]|uniref:DUF4203 domain-containing protein n=1 Tax=Gordonia phosphorivorans TaxID=1056982 RepID=A0ABV6HCN9_9ACTN